MIGCTRRAGRGGRKNFAGDENDGRRKDEGCDRAPGFAMGKLGDDAEIVAILIAGIVVVMSRVGVGGRGTALRAFMAVKQRVQRRARRKNRQEQHRGNAHGRG